MAPPARASLRADLLPTLVVSSLLGRLLRVLHYCRGMGKGGEKDDCPPRAAFKGSPKKRWVVDGVSYDLTPFLAKHPGGPDFLLWSANRDISIAVHTYHKDPARTVLPLLRRYRC